MTRSERRGLGIVPRSQSAILCVILSATVLLQSSAARAADTPAAAVSVIKAWSRATPPGATVGVAYFEIINAAADDTLTGIECACAARAEMHLTTMTNGMMQMRLTPTLDIPAKAHVVFKPEGEHVMLIDLKSPLKAGERLPLTLVFRHAGRIKVDAQIQGFGESNPPGT